MVSHCQEFSPIRCKVLGEEQLRVVIRMGLNRAMRHGFGNRGPCRLYLEMQFLFGGAFDTDPQYPWAGEILRDRADQTRRAEQLYEHTLDYLDKVTGPDNIYAHAAEAKIPAVAQNSLPYSSADFISGLLWEMERVYPQKVAYVGRDALVTLIEQGRAEARRFQFPSPRGETLLAVLMFAFGHACLDDPFYPWIYRTLHQDNITDPEARARRLEKKSLTWLDHVLAVAPKRG